MNVTVLQLGNYLTTIGSLIDRMDEENNVGKKKKEKIIIEHKGKLWQISKLKS